MPNILDLILHILNHTDKNYPSDEKNDEDDEKMFFSIGNHQAEYSSTTIIPKEHKLWTPYKKSPYRCFLMIQNYRGKSNPLYADKLIIHHLLDNVEIICRDKEFSSLEIDFPPKRTLATQIDGNNPNDQFENSVIGIKITNKDSIDERIIAKLIEKITDETVRRDLNSRQKRKKRI